MPSQTHLSQSTLVVIDQKTVEIFFLKTLWREDVLKSLAELKNNYQLYLLSGDHDQQKEHLLTYFNTQQMKFKQSPSDKSNFISGLQKEGLKVAMIGDGINDSLAMRVADVGIAIPIGSGQFTPSCDLLLPEQNFKHLSNYLTYTRKSLHLIGLCVGVSLLYNLVGISAAMSGRISPLFSAILMPLSSLSVVTLSICMSAYLSKRFLHQNSS